MFGFMLLLALFTVSFAVTGLLTYRYMRKRAALQKNDSTADNENELTSD
ncbi:hypothetical protein [uncultured Ruminococcus sp.]|nr:hypothetical protein [uncultured Ruminococcus sp.]